MFLEVCSVISVRKSLFLVSSTGTVHEAAYVKPPSQVTRRNPDAARVLAKSVSPIRPAFYVAAYELRGRSC